MASMRTVRAVALCLAGVLLLTGACAKRYDGPEVASLKANPANIPAAAATPSATAAVADRTDQLRQFAQCMRDRGVDVKDPQPGAALGGIAGMGDGIDRNDPHVIQAFQQCQSKLPNGGQPPRLNPQQVEIFRQFAQCMRDHGIDLPDPTADGGLQAPAGGLGVLQTPAFQAALVACRDKLTGIVATPTR
jgi:hypothetical protein